MNMDQAVYRIPMPAAPGAPISEFNHHLAGLVVFIVGLSALLMYTRPDRFSFLRYVWPASLLALGIYLILYGDPDGWPAMAGASLAGSIKADPSALQHKVFALLLVVMGFVELGRASRLLRGSSWRWAFPALATFGALYLLMHEHASPTHMHDMNGMHHMDHGAHASPLVRMQHMIYLGLGVGIAISKLVTDLKLLRTKWIPYVWPSLTMALGIALIFYKE